MIPKVGSTIKAWFGVGNSDRLGPYKATVVDDVPSGKMEHIEISINDPNWKSDIMVDWEPWPYVTYACRLPCDGKVRYDDFCWEPDDGNWPDKTSYYAGNEMYPREEEPGDV